MSNLFEAFKKARREGSLPTDLNLVASGGQGPAQQADPGDRRALSVEPKRPEKSPRPAAGHPLAEEELRPPEEHMVSLLDPTSFEADQYRTLRHRVEQMHNQTGFTAVAVTSPTVGDGKTITAINLAGALAQDPAARVLLVEADLRRPALMERLGMERTAGRGLVEAILDPALSLEDVVLFRREFNLSVLPVGSLPEASYEILKSPRLGELLQEARRLYDYIVLDTPPVLGGSDCGLIEKHVDGFIVVVTAHKTPRKQFEEALDSLTSNKVVGVVFNADEDRSRNYYRGGYSPGEGRNRRSRRRR